MRDRGVDERAGTEPDRYRAAATAYSTLAALTALAGEVVDQRAVDQAQHSKRAEHPASPASRTPRTRKSGARRAGPAESTGPATTGMIPGDERPGHGERPLVVDSAAEPARASAAARPGRSGGTAPSSTRTAGTGGVCPDGGVGQGEPAGVVDPAAAATRATGPSAAAGGCGLRSACTARAAGACRVAVHDRVTEHHSSRVDDSATICASAPRTAWRTGHAACSLRSWAPARSLATVDRQLAHGDVRSARD